MQEAITDIAASVLSGIPYYKERRMYEQQHKFEVFFLTKDLPDMLTLISNLPPAQRKEKEQELTVYLQEFQEEINSSHAALEQELKVKNACGEGKVSCELDSFFYTGRSDAGLPFCVLFSLGYTVTLLFFSFKGKTLLSDNESNESKVYGYFLLIYTLRKYNFSGRCLAPKSQKWQTSG
ncbi:hypothetical protein GCM10020331_089760 [Ectobacillus funiculus]